MGIYQLSKKYGFKIIEDASHSLGSRRFNEKAGSCKWSDLTVFSFHPIKPITTAEGGIITTNNKVYYEKLKLLRNHGILGRDNILEFGYVSRMDNFQAAILNYRLSKLETVIKKRRHNAALYQEMINTNEILLPKESSKEFNTYHTYVIQTGKRNQLKEYLLNKGIETAIHYPIPIHLQPSAIKFGYKLGDFENCEKQAKNILTLPIHQYLKESDIEIISNNINNFFN